MLNANPYLPELATVREVIPETHNIRSVRLRLNDEAKMEAFRFEPGQVGQLSIFGVGESTFVIASPPTRMDFLQFTVMRVGEVTTRIHQLRPGDQVGVRAPLGNWFSYEQMKGKDILFVGGGVGMAPLRTLLLYMLDNRSDYGDISLVYGARTPKDLCYKDEMEQFRKRDDFNLYLTVDSASPDWHERVGVVPAVVTELAPEPSNTVAITCGPPIMIKYAVEALVDLGFKDDQIITTLERRMKCGVGLCGRCNIGTSYVCVDGPVFSVAQLKDIRRRIGSPVPQDVSRAL